jgi:hypothetical protein
VGTGSYAAVAAQQPFGLVALRFRGIKYWWAGLGLAVLVALYAAPIGASFRQPSLPATTTPLPSLTLPAVGFPLFKAAKLHRLAPLPPLTHHASTAAAATRQAAQPVTQRTQPLTVPVVTDVHAQAPRGATTKSNATPKDPFVNVPVVSDNIGSPVSLAASAPAAPAAAAPPAATAPTDTTGADQTQTQTDDGGMGWFTVDSTTDTSPTTADTPPDPAQEQVTATIGSSDTGTLGAGDSTAATTEQTVTADTGSADVVSATTSSDPGTPEIAPAGTTSDSGGAAGNTSSDPNIQGATGGATAGGTSSGDTTGTTASDTAANQSDGASAAGTSADLPSSDPAATPGSGPSPPAEWSTATSGSTPHTISLRLNGSNLELTADGTLSSRPLAEVSSVSIVGTPDVNDTLTVDLSGGAILVPISFDGGAAGYDTLIVTGSTPAPRAMWSSRRRSATTT